MKQSLPLAVLLAGSLSFSAVAQVAETEKPSEPKVKATPTAPTIEVDNSSPTSLIESVNGFLADGNPQAIWAAIAPAHRQQLQDVLRQAATKVDPQVYNTVMGVVGKLHTLLDTNASFIANNKMLGNFVGPTMKPEELLQRIKTAAAMFGDVQKSQLGSHAGLTQLDLGKFFIADGKSMINGLMNISEVKVGKVDVPEEGKALVTVASANGEEQIPLHEVQGAWYFDLSEPLEDMKKDIADAKGMDKQSAMQVNGLIQMMVMPMLARFEGLESQEEFDDAVNEAQRQIMGMFGGMGGGGVAPRGPGGGGYGR